MNKVIETLLQHRSIRKFIDKNVAKETLEQILSAACNGSTMGNMQLYSIIVTEDKKKMKEMSSFHFNQPVATNAPVILTFCADFNRFNKFCKFRDAETGAYSNMQSYHWAVIDAIIAAQNACIAAESLGLGICWLGTITYNVDKFIDFFKMPELVIPVACIAIGYPDEDPPITDKLPINAFIHHEVYRDYDKKAIDEIYKEKENNSNTLQLYKENKINNLAKIFTQNRYKKEDNEYFAEILTKELKKQGFIKDNL